MVMILSTAANTIAFGHHSLSQRSGKEEIFCFHNCLLFRNGAFLQLQSDKPQLWVRNGKVLNPLQVSNEEQKEPTIFVDCKGLILAPGFMDIQVNGAFGIDFTELATGKLDGNKGNKERANLILGVAQKLLQYGVTSFCPTIITAPPDAYKNFAGLLRFIKSPENVEKQLADCILGAHFEGPFISKVRSGCHHKPDIINPLPASSADSIVDSVYGSDFSNVRIVTLAPEIERADEIVAEVCRRGCKVSIGHSNASLEEATQALRTGASCITHLFNAMTPFNHRYPGIVGALLDHSTGAQPYFGMITDGLHLAESAILFAHCADPDGAILITDCISALGMGNGLHQLGDQRVVVEGITARIQGTETLAGSVSSMPHCIKHYASCLEKIKKSDCTSSTSLEKALRAATLHPAKFLGISERKGTLVPGSDADFVLLDEQMNIFATFVSGVKYFDAGKDGCVNGTGETL